MGVYYSGIADPRSRQPFSVVSDRPDEDGVLAVDSGWVDGDGHHPGPASADDTLLGWDWDPRLATGA